MNFYNAQLRKFSRARRPTLNFQRPANRVSALNVERWTRSAHSTIAANELQAFAG